MSFQAHHFPHTSKRVIIDKEDFDEDDFKGILEDTKDYHLKEFTFTSPLTDEIFFFYNDNGIEDILFLPHKSCVAFYCDDHVHVIEWIKESPGFLVHKS